MENEQRNTILLLFLRVITLNGYLSHDNITILQNIKNPVVTYTLITNLTVVFHGNFQKKEWKLTRRIGQLKIIKRCLRIVLDHDREIIQIKFQMKVEFMTNT